MKISKEIKIAVVFVAGLALLYWGINFLKGRDLFRKERTYYALYKQINGLTKANPILVNGFRVGQVEDIHFSSDTTGQIVVVMSITNKDLQIPDNSTAKIYSSNLLGSMAVELVLGDSKKMAVEGDTLKNLVQLSLSDQVSVQFQPIKQKFENVMISLDSVLTIIREVFNENTRRNLEQSFESIRATVKNLEHTTYNIDTLFSGQKHNLAEIISNVESISENIKNNNDKISNVIANFSSISDTLAKAHIASTINNADRSLKDFSDIIAKINRGEGSLGMLVNNDSLYNNLDKSSKELNELVKDIKLNPHRYLNFSVFGPSKKKNEYKPSE
ncbi:MAG TPA: MlaD family protein [Bacteroidales bacterium]|nr:MlaD family protein [Bacteroidales bacterium]